jgi:uncharacterized protein (DUF2252 family)
MTDKQEESWTSSRKERQAKGKALREQASWNSHSGWQPAADRPDPISLLQAQDASRVQYLVPIKYGRMAESAFAFFRGSAVVMAADLAGTPTSGMMVHLCGDAHLSNFGVFATPERKLVFDLNDFDETHPGPWEWDLKRLAASAVLAGRENGFSKKKNRNAAKIVVKAYARAMKDLSEMKALDVWYYHVEVDVVQKVLAEASKEGKKSAKKMVRKARSKTQEQTLEKLTYLEDGRRRFISDPPLLVPFRELLSEEEKEQLSAEQIRKHWGEYMDSLPPDRRRLIGRYYPVDMALRVGGVGSVGTRCAIMLLQGESEDDAIILQQKEAGESVLETHLGQSEHTNPAQRVVEGQRLMQASSDIFLGWHQGSISNAHYYWRQLKDMKGSVDPSTLDEAGFNTYMAICATCLARAHARMGDAVVISGYLGKGKSLGNAIADFAVAYADQTELDHQALVEAIESGRVVAETGI